MHTKWPLCLWWIKSYWINEGYNNQYYNKFSKFFIYLISIFIISLSVDKQETKVYFASQQSPIHAYVLNADTGSVDHKLYL